MSPMNAPATPAQVDQLRVQLEAMRMMLSVNTRERETVLEFSNALEARADVTRFPAGTPPDYTTYDIAVDNAHARYLEAIATRLSMEINGLTAQVARFEEAISHLQSGIVIPRPGPGRRQ